MNGKDWFLLISEILVPVVLALLAKNNAIINSSYSELKSIKRDISEDKRTLAEFKTEISSLLKQNDRVTERNTRLIEQLINNKCLGDSNNEA